MKLFRFYSTAKNNSNIGDTIVNMDGQKLLCMKCFFDIDEDKSFFAIIIELPNATFKEFHDDMEFTKERMAEILCAFDVPKVEAITLANSMRFLKI